MAKGDPVTSPYVWSCADYLGRKLTATFNFNNGTGGLASCRIDRDAGCLFDALLIGVGVDGRPDSTVSAVRAHGQGVVTLTPPQLAAMGFNTITDILNAGQITAGL